MDDEQARGGRGAEFKSRPTLITDIRSSALGLVGNPPNNVQPSVSQRFRFGDGTLIVATKDQPGQKDRSIRVTTIQRRPAIEDHQGHRLYGTTTLHIWDAPIIGTTASWEEDTEVSRDDQQSSPTRPLDSQLPRSYPDASDEQLNVILSALEDIDPQRDILDDEGRTPGERAQFNGDLAAIIKQLKAVTRKLPKVDGFLTAHDNEGRLIKIHLIKATGRNRIIGPRIAGFTLDVYEPQLLTDEGEINPVTSFFYQDTYPSFTSTRYENPPSFHSEPDPVDILTSTHGGSLYYEGLVADPVIDPTTFNARVELSPQRRQEFLEYLNSLKE
jgi:hypothetical protein